MPTISTESGGMLHRIPPKPAQRAKLGCGRKAAMLEGLRRTIERENRLTKRHEKRTVF
jgi:hypothetical protein